MQRYLSFHLMSYYVICSAEIDSLDKRTGSSNKAFSQAVL